MKDTISERRLDVDIAKEGCRALFAFTFTGTLTVLLNMLKEQFVPLPLQLLLFPAAAILKKNCVQNLIKPEGIQLTACAFIATLSKKSKKNDYSFPLRQL